MEIKIGSLMLMGILHDTDVVRLKEGAKYNDTALGAATTRTLGLHVSISVFGNISEVVQLLAGVCTRVELPQKPNSGVLQTRWLPHCHRTTSDIKSIIT